MDFYLRYTILIIKEQALPSGEPPTEEVEE